MDKLINPATGNEFDVIGLDSANSLVAGIRFWIVEDKGKCMVAMRVRVEAEPGTPIPASMEATCKAAYPKAKWTGGSSKHGSTAGAIRTNYPAWQADAILQALKDGDVGGSLHDAFSAVYETMRFLLNREQFALYFLQRVEYLLKGAPSETSPKVTIEFMGYTKESAPNEPVQVAEPPTLTTPLEETVESL